MKRFVFTRDAEADLCEIWAYIAADSLDAADMVQEELHVAIHDLMKMPMMGHLREDLTKRPFRFWRVRDYLIIYNVGDDILEILRILHGRQDLESILLQLS